MWPGMWSNCELRLDLIKNIMTIDTAIMGIPHSERFVYLLNNKDIRIIREVMAYICKAYAFRAGILSGKQSANT
jgi:hypothetical protein